MTTATPGEAGISDEIVQTVYGGMHFATCVNHGPHCDKFKAQVRDAIRVGLSRAWPLITAALADRGAALDQARRDGAAEALREAADVLREVDAPRDIVGWLRRRARAAGLAEQGDGE